MKKAIRILSVLSILGLIAVFSQRIQAMESVFATDSGATILGAIGAITAFAAFGAWGLAVYHWGTRFPIRSPSRRSWGVVVILGAFIGAWLYGFFAPVDDTDR